MSAFFHLTIKRMTRLGAELLLQMLSRTSGSRVSRHAVSRAPAIPRARWRALSAAMSLIALVSAPAGVTAQTVVGAKFSIASGWAGSGAAFDGTNFLVALESDTSAAKVAAQLMSSTGAKIGAAIALGHDGQSCCAAGIAFDGTNYLVAWEEDQGIKNSWAPFMVYGRFINKSGAQAGPAFAMSTAGITFDGINMLAFGGGKYLLTYTRLIVPNNGDASNNRYVAGRMISPDGSLGSEFRISTGFGNASSVGFDGMNFFVVWKEDSLDFEVRARFVSASGAPGQEISINASPALSDNPVLLSYDGTNYLVVWTDDAGAGGDVYAQRVSSGGALVGGPIAVVSEPGMQLAMGAGFDGINYLVTWVDMKNDANGNGVCDASEGTCWDIYGQYVGKDGVLVGSKFAVNTDAGNQIGGVGCAGGPCLALVSSGILPGDGGPSQVGEVYGAFLTAQGPATTTSTAPTTTTTAASTTTTLPATTTSTGATTTTTSISTTTSTTALPTTSAIWETKASMPTGRWGAASGVIGAKLYVAGGETGSGASAALEVYDPASNSWSSKAPMPTARSSVGGAAIDGKLYVVGGDIAASQKLATLEVYDPATDTWTTKTSMPTPRSSPGVVAIAGKLYVAGGCRGWCAPATGILEVYDPASDSWTTKAAMPTARGIAAVEVANSLFYVMGGCCGSTSADSQLKAKTIEAYDPATDTWVSKAQHGVGVSGTAGTIGAKIYLAESGPAEAYDPATDTWAAVAPMPAPQRSSAAGGVINGTLYLAGGTADNTSALTTLTTLTPGSITPYTPDGNTVLLDHFDNTTSASILAFSENGAACGSAKPTATPNSAYGPGPDGLNLALTLLPPLNEPIGSRTYLQYPGGQLLSQANGSIEFWTYLTMYGQGVSLVYQTPYMLSCNGWTFNMGVNASGQLQASAWAAFDMNSGTTTMPLNAWTHVAASWGGAGAKLYINGALVGSDANTGMPASGYGGSVLIGAGGNVGVQFDELRISDVQRTSFPGGAPGNGGTPGSRYIDNGDGTITDATTGLIWMRCAMGQSWAGGTCSGTAGGYNWDQANALTGTVNFAGQSDWRLPNIRELHTIVDRSRSLPAIDPVTFPNTPTSNFRSATAVPYEPLHVWSVEFSAGLDGSNDKDGAYQVRLVRAGQALGSALNPARPTTDYVDHGDGTVTHMPTGLMWQRCVVGATWTGSTCSDTWTIHTWQAAMAMTDTFAGHADWRLPTEDELLSLADYTTPAPAINTTIFPATRAEFFWSATSVAYASDHAWMLFSSGGSVYQGLASQSYPVRLVRAGQTPGTSTSTSTTTTTTATGATTTSTGSTTTTTLGGGGGASLVAGWNLLGNGQSDAISVAGAFGDSNSVITVWKWLSASNAWAFYTPTLTDGGAAYAASKGYTPLTTIDAGDGFWVNAKAPFSLQLSGSAMLTSMFADGSGAKALPAGWSLIAIGDGKTPGQFANAISAIPPTAGLSVANSLITLWAWDAALSNWYFYAPSLVNDGTQASYISTKGYLDFATANKKLSPTTGFWVNHP